MLVTQAPNRDDPLRGSVATSKRGRCPLHRGVHRYELDGARACCCHAFCVPQRSFSIFPLAFLPWTRARGGASARCSRLCERTCTLAAPHRRPASVGVAHLLPAPGAGRAGQEQPMRPDRCTEARATVAGGPDRAGSGAAACRARSRHCIREAGPSDAGDALRNRVEGIGAGQSASGAGKSAPGRIASGRQGRQGTARSPRRAGGRLAGTLSRERPRSDSRRETELGAVPYRSRWCDDSAGILASRQALCRTSGNLTRYLPSHAATRIRNPPPRSRCRPPRGPDAARAPRYIHHPDLHPHCTRTAQGHPRAASSTRLRGDCGAESSFAELIVM